MATVVTVGIDGPIGVGKSTAVRRIVKSEYLVRLVLGDDAEVIDVLEPLVSWQSCDLFQLMCEYPAEWSAEFQHVALVTRVSKWTAAWQRARERPAGRRVFLLLERPPASDRMVFTHVQNARGVITDVDAEEHGRWYKRMWAKRPSDIERIGLLTCDFDVARKRIDARKRDGEGKYDYEYLRALHERYARVASEPEWSNPTSTVALDATRAFDRCDRALMFTMADLFDVQLDAERTASVVCTCNNCALSV
jgi:deoxyadenosine/deoxycytidine kinase